MRIGEIPAAVHEYRRRGYVILKGGVPSATLDEVERILDRCEQEWERRLRGLPDGRSWISHADEITFTARLAGKEPALRRLLESPPLLEFALAVVGPSPRLYFDQAVYKKPGCAQVVPWHQDNGYNPKVPADYVTFWMPLSDTTIENGTIRVQPGRHREGTLAHWRDEGGYLVCEAGAEGGEPIELRRGDVLAFSSLLPHATGPNVTSRQRKAYIASCVPDGTRLADGSPCDDDASQPLLGL